MCILLMIWLQSALQDSESYWRWNSLRKRQKRTEHSQEEIGSLPALYQRRQGESWQITIQLKKKA